MIALLTQRTHRQAAECQTAKICCELFIATLCPAPYRTSIGVLQASHTSRIEQRQKEKEHKSMMNEQMQAVADIKAATAAEQEKKAQEAKERQRSSIATPGMRTPLTTPRRRFGL